jgi:hypothetical protein
MDYLVSVLLIAAPWLFQFAAGGAETWVPVTLGIMTILYSLITNYEYSVANVIPFSTHLGIDAVSGILLMASPWLFGFSDKVYMPHLIFGILEVGVVLMTDRHKSAVGTTHSPV